MRTAVGRGGAVVLAGRLMAGALAGKVLGFVREIEMARLLGAGFVADSFRAATTATLLPIAAMQGDMVPGVMIPLHRVWAEEGTARLRFALLSLLLILVTLPLTLGVMLLANVWTDVLAAGFGPEEHAITVGFVRIMSLAMPATVLINCCSCVEISRGRSRISVIRASVQNLAIIAAIVLMSVTGDAMLMGWAYALSMNGTALYGLVMLVREDELTLRGASVREAVSVGGEFLRSIRALLVQPFAEQLNSLLERSLASAVTVGAVASIDYARTLTDTALYMISQPIGYVVLAQHGAGRDETAGRVDRLLRLLLAMTLPASIFLVVFAHDIISVLLQRGAFQQHAVMLSSHVMLGTGAGLWATTTGLVLLRMLNAAGRNRMASLVLAGGWAANALVNVLLVPRIGVMGVGLGDSARGTTLLYLTACSLGCGGLLLRRVIGMLPPALGVIAIEAAIQHFVGQPLLRLAAGGTATALCTVAFVLAYNPDVYRQSIARLRLRRVAAGRMN